jgi:hypothetical protein
MLLSYDEMIPVEDGGQYLIVMIVCRIRSTGIILKWKGLVKNAYGYPCFSSQRIRETAREI